jgi:hypothetical protein
MLNKIKNFTAGYKTYFIALIAVLVNFAVYMNWLTVDQLTQVNAILGFLGIAAVRAGVAK